MVGLKLLLIASTLILAGPAQAGPAVCTPGQAAHGSCTPPVVTVGTTPEEVVLEGTVDRPGTSGPGNTGPSSPPVIQPPLTIDRPGYTFTMPVTLSDLVRFRPSPGVDRMQPDGWMIVGLDTNFIAHATQHVKSGTLLGQPASVRFTPVRYHWTYGDGSTRTSTTPGATWQALGLHDFDATATSHVYRSPGTYFIDLTIGFAPEYHYADGTEWIPVSGLIWVPANRLVAEAAAGAKTVLVEDECTIDPSGPGC